MNLTEVEEHITVKYEIKRRLGKGVSKDKSFKGVMADFFLFLTSTHILEDI